MVVEDDVYLRQEIANTFVNKGYEVTTISCFNDVENEIIKAEPDLVVLDVNLPGKSGFEICKYIKYRTQIPILILTARDTLLDEVALLRLGADDFLTKPCHPDRLLARADRLISTYGKIKNMMKVGELVLELETHRAIYKEAYVVLPETEEKILKALMEAYPSVVTKKELFSKLWGGNEYVDENILQVNMTRLRKRLESIGQRDIVCTVRGEGYCLKVSLP